jgi:alpha-L-rhamnosidase
MSLLAMVAATSLQAAGTLVPVALRCEYLESPAGITVERPRLSWKLQAAREGLRDLRQSAFRVLVASKPADLKEGRADIWDSGRVASSNSIHVEYEGKPLVSNRVYWWTVRVWDQDGNPSAWSKPSNWSTGLFRPCDWKAQWIGFDEPLAKRADEPSFRGAKWIGHPDDNPDQAPKAHRFFRHECQVPAGVSEARLLVTADDQFVLELNGKEVAHSDGKQDAWRRPVALDAKNHLRTGTNRIQLRTENAAVGHSGLVLKLSMRHADGTWTHVVTNKAWQVSATQDGVFVPARELFSFGDGPWGWVGTSALFLPPPRYLRKEFEASRPVRRAVLFASALGNADFQLNGKKVGDEFFLPGWTDYEKRVYYRAYDVTKAIKRGRNALGAILADGWYAGYVGYGGRREHYGDKPRALAQLAIEYADGTNETIATDRSWRASTGPLLEADFLMGETYDARKELAGWDAPGYDDSSWKSVDVGAATKVGVLEGFPGNPVRAYAEVKPKTIVSDPKKPDAYVLDLGQNLAGFVRIKVRGKPGQKIVLRFAERLNPDGTIYTTNLRGARTVDNYICKGQGEEVWQPRFTFHGFQYVEVSGLGSKPKPEDVVGIALSSDTARVGTLETSDPMLNQLVSNAWWTQRMNFIDIPTDCPQRDERLGWTGDAQAYIRTATYYDDVQAFFTKWLVTLDDGQRADGQYPMVAPVKVAGDDGGPAWADAGVICPWTIYDVYGDKRLLARHYPQMKKFVEFCRARSTAELLPPEKFHCFGDWVSINAATPNEVIYTAYFAYSSSLLAQAARVLGHLQDAREYEDLSRRVKAAFNRAYVSPEGVVKGDTQCAYVLALSFDLVESEMAKKCAERLVADIEKRGWKLSTGFVGTRDIMHALTKIGRNDVAFRLLHSTEFPSWGFTIKNGATSIWERWDGWTPEKGFQDPGMNSFAHYAFGAVVGWMFDQLPGIRNLEPGFAKVRIAPAIDPNLKWVKGSYDSIRGKIVCEWEYRASPGSLTMRVIVPTNTAAEVHVPVAEGGQVRAPFGLKPVRREGSSAVFEVGSGTYEFRSSWRS